MKLSKTGKEMPFISIVISCRNEEKYIGKCFNSIIENDYPKDKIEVLAIDGRSEDATREIVNDFAQQYEYFKLLDNPQKVTPVAMNIGIKSAKGDLIILVNAHSILERDFLKLNVEYSEKTKADAVGGKLNTINENNSLFGECIPLAADSIFGTGGRRYRNSTTEGFVQDTLPYCSYSKNTFEKYGYIDEELIRDQDEEFNYRILTRGGKIYFAPKIKSLLFIRPSLKKLWKQHFQYGFFKPLVSKKVGTALTWRQLIPAAFVGSVISTGIGTLLYRPIGWIFGAILGLYFSVNLLFSLKIALKKKLKYFFGLPFVFPTLHWSYGWGYLKGIWSFIILKQNKKKKLKDIPLSR